MEKLKMHTPNITAENIEKLGALFPDCVTEIKDDKTGQLKRAYLARSRSGEVCYAGVATPLDCTAG